VAPDPERALGLYDACANAGDVDAFYEAGRCRYYGIGTAADPAAAAAAFAIARRFGHAEASCDAAESDGPRRRPPREPRRA
jgi:TPR repeat protein